MDRHSNDASTETRRKEAVLRRLRDALERPTEGDSGTCLDAEQIAAYQERALTPEEIAQCEGHFAACQRCREILSTMASAASLALAQRDAQGAVAKQSHSRALFLPWRLRWLAPALAATAVLALWFVLGVTWRSGGRTTQALIAEAPQAEPPPNNEGSVPPGNSEEDARAGRASPAPIASWERSSASAAPSPSFGQGTGPIAEAEAPAAQAAPSEGVSRKQDAGQTQPGVGGQSAGSAAANAEADASAADRAIDAASPSLRQSEIQPTPRAPASRAADSRAATMARADNIVRAGNMAPLSSNLARDEFVVVLNSPSDAASWRAGAAGRIQRSSDGGRTWQAQQSPLQEDWLAGNAASDTVCWLVGRNGAIARTGDGEHWQQITGPVAALGSAGERPDWVGVTAIDAQRAIIVLANQMKYLTRDAGQTWQLQP